MRYIMSESESSLQFRLSPADLFKITGRRRALNQAKWFTQYLGVVVPCDTKGPVLTKASYEALVAKRVGLLPLSTSGTSDVIVHPRAPKQAAKRASQIGG